MSAQHTPGPWTRDTQGHPCPDVRAASGRAVAHTWMVCGSTPKTAEGYQKRRDEDRANARLIAAAPELLEVLSIALELLRNVEPFAGQADILAGCIEAGSSAIAKATGDAA